ncbi:hypothetical protein GCM10023189_51690 [Nibrella saemangeumensis]|uniref:HTH LytTR-type domain-containing protein n=1 Tax=Nibrella saemangeumensis TaxID=1084526 RepID=A0ABP8NL55_9BACT
MREYLRKRPYVTGLAGLVLLITVLKHKTLPPASALLLEFGLQYSFSLTSWQVQLFIFRYFLRREEQKAIRLPLILKVSGTNLFFFAVFYLLAYLLIVLVIYDRSFNLHNYLIGFLIGLLFAAAVNLYFWLDQLLRAQPERGKIYTSELLRINTGGQTMQVPITDIACFQLLEKIVFVVLRNGRKMSTDFTISELEASLEQDTFYRLNRQVIVSRNSIQSVQPIENFKLKVSLNVADSTLSDLTVSRYKTAAFRKWLNND